MKRSFCYSSSLLISIETKACVVSASITTSYFFSNGFLSSNTWTSVLVLSFGCFTIKIIASKIFEWVNDGLDSTLGVQLIMYGLDLMIPRSSFRDLDGLPIRSLSLRSSLRKSNIMRAGSTPVNYNLLA